MFTIVETDKKSIFFIGDIHGEFKSIRNWIKINNLSDCALVFCGDFGLGFSSVAGDTAELKKPNKLCEERDIECYIIRGNHDDPSYFKDEDPKLVLSRFKTVSDYTVINCPEHNILCLGGAVSIDRLYRLSQYNSEINNKIVHKHYSFQKAVKETRKIWWEDEAFVYNEKILEEINKHGSRIDIVASHSAPDFCQPINKIGLSSWGAIDNELENDLYNERKDFTNAYEYLTKTNGHIDYWFYGHYHQHNYEIIDGTKFIGLDMGRNSKLGGVPGGIFDMSQIR